MKCRYLKITTDCQGVYLFQNTKKPYWKKKPISYIEGNTFAIWDLHGIEIETDNLYFSYFIDGDDLRPIKENTLWQAI